MFDPRPLYYSSLTTAVGGTKDTNIVDSGSPVLGFQGKALRLLFFFFFFSISFCFFFSFLEDFIGLHTWVTKTYYGSSIGLRPALQSEQRCIASQPIGTIWSAVCELAKGGMFKVEHAETSID